MSKSRYFSLEDFNKIIDSIPRYRPQTEESVKNFSINSRQLQLLCKMLFYCGLLIEEALSLTKSDLNLIRRIITVKTKLLLPQTTIPPNILPEITEYIKDIENDQRLFVLSRQQAYKIIKELGTFAGVEVSKVKKGKVLREITPLSFRQSYRQYMMNQCTDEDLVNLKLRLRSEHLVGVGINDLLQWERNFYKIMYFTEDEITKFKEEYTQKQPIYQKLSEEVSTILGKNIDSKNIDIQEITPRVKSIESFEDKIRSGISFHPSKMQDLAAVRIICYVKSDVDKVCKIIEDIFDIDFHRSRDKSKTLGENIVGYSSIHYIAKFTASRLSVDSYYNIFKDLYFEIQVRTILQHAWAEIEHDRMYKKKNLPEPLKRRFNLVSGLLEIADNEFQSLHDMGENVS